MALGRKTGGRTTAGAPNKRTAEVEERLGALGCDPIEGMARIAMDATNAPELRGRMFAELAQYVSPKRKAVEHSATDGGSFQFSWLPATDPRELSSAELVDQVLQRIASGQVEAEQVTPLMDTLRTQLALKN
jgi:hypothetical protein